MTVAGHVPRQNRTRAVAHRESWEALARSRAALPRGLRRRALDARRREHLASAPRRRGARRRGSCRISPCARSASSSPRIARWFPSSVASVARRARRHAASSAGRRVRPRMHRCGRGEPGGARRGVRTRPTRDQKGHESSRVVAHTKATNAGNRHHDACMDVDGAVGTRSTRLGHLARRAGRCGHVSRIPWPRSSSGSGTSSHHQRGRHGLCSPRFRDDRWHHFAFAADPAAAGGAGRNAEGTGAVERAGVAACIRGPTRADLGVPRPIIGRRLSRLEERLAHLT